MPKLYRLIAHTVEAIQLTAESVERAAMWCGGMVIDEYDAIDSTKKFSGMNIPTLNGVKRASEGDYIVKGPKGIFTVSPANVFESEYELAE